MFFKIVFISETAKHMYSESFIHSEKLYLTILVLKKYGLF